MVKDYQRLKESISIIIQQSGLDVGIVYFILKDILKDIERLYYGQINKELMEESNSEEIRSEKANATEQTT